MAKHVRRRLNPRCLLVAGAGLALTGCGTPEVFGIEVQNTPGCSRDAGHVYGVSVRAPDAGDCNDDDAGQQVYGIFVNEPDGG